MAKSRPTSGRRSTFRERLKAGRSSSRTKKSMSPASTMQYEDCVRDFAEEVVRKAEMTDEKRRTARSLQCGYCSQIFRALDGEGTVKCKHCGMSSNREVNAKCGKCSKIFVGIAGTHANCPYCKVENAIPEETERPLFTAVQCGSCKKAFTAEQQGGPHELHNALCPFCGTTNAFRAPGAAVKTVKAEDVHNKVIRPQNSKRDTIDSFRAGIVADEGCAQYSRRADEAVDNSRVDKEADGKDESRDLDPAASSESGPARRASSALSKEEIMADERRRLEREKAAEETRRKEQEQRRVEEIRREEASRRQEERRREEEKRRKEEEQRRVEEIRREEASRRQEERRREEEKRRSARNGSRDGTKRRADAGTRDGNSSADFSESGASVKNSAGNRHEESLGISAVTLELQDMRNKGTSLTERRRFFQQLCLRWHPDKNPDSRDDSTRVFQHLQERKEWFLS